MGGGSKNGELKLELNLVPQDFTRVLITNVFTQFNKHPPIAVLLCQNFSEKL